MTVKYNSRDARDIDFAIRAWEGKRQRSAVEVGTLRKMAKARKNARITREHERAGFLYI